MRFLAIFAVIFTIFANTAVAERKIIKRVPKYLGPEITQVLVDKSERKMYLLNGKKVVKKFKIDLGFAPQGHKFKEGDGRTPEGLYYIDRDNVRSKFFLSLGISYPNARDIARAREAGVKPGGQIFIHGGPRTRKEGKTGDDWTAGCISVSDKQMGWVWSMVKVGTPIFIKP